MNRDALKHGRFNPFKWALVSGFMCLVFLLALSLTVVPNLNAGYTVGHGIYPEKAILFGSVILVVLGWELNRVIGLKGDFEKLAMNVASNEEILAQ